ncbi:MAG: flavin reductase family protein [Spirochaetia bacterium]|nr:flavin reductase family protein [Spirochaetia bacterium]
MKIESFHNNNKAYYFLTSLIIPRPIAFITTINSNKTVNAAPFSYFSPLSSDPILISVSIYNKANGEKKDTLKNIIDSGEFCINMVNELMSEDMTICGAGFPYGISELDYTNLHTVSCDKIQGVRIKEAPASLEIKLKKIINDLGEDFSVVIGEVKVIHVNDDIIDTKTGNIDAKKSRIIGRLGGNQYLNIENIFSIERKACSEYIKRKNL